MYDVIVIGVGSMGSAACYYLAKAGMKVLGIEQFDIAHQNGSHSGHTRIIRKAYFEHPAYVPLLEQAYKNWNEIEEISGENIFYRTGLLYIGEAEGPLFCGLKQSANEYQIPLKEFSPTEINKEFPAFKIPDGHSVLFEVDAGFIVADKAIRSYTREAREYGATIMTLNKIRSWQRIADSYEIDTEKGKFSAKKIVITAGAWTSELLHELQIPLDVSVQTLHWVEVDNQNLYVADHFPCWVVETSERKGVYYGFPITEVSDVQMPQGLKVAHHFPGINAAVGKGMSNMDLEKSVESIKAFSQKYFVDKKISVRDTKICYYTNTPDGHFIIDFLPEYNTDVVIACGFSGHGFKFVSAVGEHLAEMVIKGEKPTQEKYLDLFALDRFSH